MTLGRPGKRGGESLLSLARTKAEKRRAKAASIFAYGRLDASLVLRGLLNFPGLSLAGGAA